jgi:hypothetical protein
MFWLKMCPRCRGDLYDSKDGYGRYVACLQCGSYLGELEEVAPSVMQALSRQDLGGDAVNASTSGENRALQVAA